ncbi:MAG: cob(I)yrinic acid a,c-diamide adenosyltransferase [Synergistaceae bacterium]|jgi:cob(I)alamin adenosyltransferase|nr:cob(I)yrinic acid a,c-diamide adenosyltransferase [Synergistaceae bacterium]
MEKNAENSDKNWQQSVYDSMRDRFSRGYVQVYTGNGKGKTTAALGLSIRALGAGMRVFFSQFIKGAKYSEIDILSAFENLTHRQYGLGCFIMRAPTDEDKAAARQGIEEVREAMNSGRYQLVILDEANVASHLGLIPASDLVALAREKPEAVELLFTGRNAPAELIELADLVTEMREIKHYYDKGVKARRGIES